MDTSLVGAVGRPFQMVVELGKIREFARATKSDNPAYKGAVGEKPLTPGTFLMTAGFWQDDDCDPMRGAGRDWHRVLHGEQEFVFHGIPPRAGDILVGQTRIDKVYEKQGRRGGALTFYESVTEFRDPAGELVAETRSTTIETTQAVS